MLHRVAQGIRFDGYQQFDWLADSQHLRRLGLPWIIKGVLQSDGVEIPGSSIVSKAAILLAIGSLLLIGITLIPAMIYKENKARLGV